MFTHIFWCFRKLHSNSITALEISLCIWFHTTPFCKQSLRKGITCTVQNFRLVKQTASPVYRLVQCTCIIVKYVILEVSETEEKTTGNDLFLQRCDAPDPGHSQEDLRIPHSTPEMDIYLCQRESPEPRQWSLTEFNKRNLHC